jgi:hypothetical protein
MREVISMSEGTTVSTHGPAYQELADLAAAPVLVQSPVEASAPEPGRFVEGMGEILGKAAVPRKEKVVAEECAWCGSPVMLAFARTVTVGMRRLRYHESCPLWSRSMPAAA